MAEQTEADWKDFTKVTLGAAALLTSLGGLALTGLLGRAQRNHPGWFLASLILVTGAGMFWVIASVMSSQPITISRSKPTGKTRAVGVVLLLAALVIGVFIDTPWRLTVVILGAVVALWFGSAHGTFKLSSGGAQVIGTILFAAGLLAGFGAVILTQQDVERPFVSANLDPESLELSGTVKVTNLGSEEHLRLFIDGLTTKPGGSFDQELLYKAFLGPDSEGVVSAPIDFLVPPGIYDHIGIRAWTDKDADVCTDYVVAKVRTRGAGCLLILTPPVPRSPNLFLTWDNEQSALTVDLKSRNSALPVAVRVIGVEDSDQTKVALGSFVFEPDHRGGITTTQTIYPPVGIHYVCAEARFFDGIPEAGERVTCPLGVQEPAEYTAIAQIAIPPRKDAGAAEGP